MDVPFAYLELDRNLTLVRPTADDRPVTDLDEEVEVKFVNETDVAAFPEAGVPELCIIPVVRALAVVLTPTCDLHEDRWLFSPLRRVADQPKINHGTLHSTSKGYGDAFGIYARTGLFDESYISFHDMISIPSEPFRYFRQSRVANLTRESQRFLEEKLARFLSRGWGFAPGDKVGSDGYYKCRLCSHYYGLPERIISLKAGDSPPKCKTCGRGQWEILLKHKKSKDIIAETPKAGLLTRLVQIVSRASKS